MFIINQFLDFTIFSRLLSPTFTERYKNGISAPYTNCANPAKKYSVNSNTSPSQSK